MSPGSGPTSSSLSSVAARSGESCRFAGASIRPSGMPFPSTMSDRFMPSLPRPGRAAARAFPAAGGLGDAPVDCQVLQDQADDPVVWLPRDLLQLAEDPGLDPLVT